MDEERGKGGMIHVEQVKASSIISHLNDFNGDAAKWREAYFRLISLRNTFGVILTMDVWESRKMGVLVRVVVHNENVERVLSTMEDLGYGAIKVYEAIIGEVEHDTLIEDFIEAN